MTFLSRNTVLCGAVVVSLLTFALFFRVGSFEMQQYDDPKHVFENPLILNPSLKNVAQFWEKPFFSLYVPVTYTVWALVSNFAGANPSPAAFHRLNLFLHMLNAALLFLVLWTILNRRDAQSTRSPRDEMWQVAACAIGTCVFAWHPLQVEPVAWISCAKDLLCMAFGLGAILAQWRSREQSVPADKNLWRGIAFVLFLACLLSKPAGIVVPLWVVVLDRFVFDIGFKKSVSEIAFWFAVIVPVLWVTKGEQPTTVIDTLGPIWSRPFIALDAIGFYFRKLFVPWHLGVDYTRTPRAVLESGWVLIHSAWVCVLLALCFLSRRRFPSLALSVLLSLLPLVPVLGLIPFSFQTSSTVADRYFYLCFLGVSLGVALGISKLKDMTWRSLAPIPLLALFALSALQLEVWRNSERLFTHTLTYYPKSLISYTNLGFEYHIHGQFELAEENFKKANELSPNNADLLVNLGAAQTARGYANAGIATLTKALSINPRNVNAHYNLGMANLRMRNLTKAIEHLKVANELAPKIPQIQRALQTAQGELAKK